MTSVQNCFTVPAMTGPRHTTGSVSFSNKRFSETSFTPVLLSAGMMPSSVPESCWQTPKARGMEGPVMSASKMAVSKARRRIFTAIREATIDLPTPPFPLTMPITFFTWLLALASAAKSLFRLSQFALHVLQSWVHSSLMVFISIKILGLLAEMPLHRRKLTLLIMIASCRPAVKVLFANI